MYVLFSGNIILKFSPKRLGLLLSFNAPSEDKKNCELQLRKSPYTHKLRISHK